MPRRMHTDAIAGTSELEWRSRNLGQIAAAAVNEIGIQIMRAFVGNIKVSAPMIGGNINRAPMCPRGTLAGWVEGTCQRIHDVLRYPASFVLRRVKKFRRCQIDF